jgi:hypothetical protein
MGISEKCDAIRSSFPNHRSHLYMLLYKQSLSDANNPSVLISFCDFIFKFQGNKSTVILGNVFDGSSLGLDVEFMTEWWGILPDM